MPPTSATRVPSRADFAELGGGRCLINPSDAKSEGVTR